MTRFDLTKVSDDVAAAREQTHTVIDVMASNIAGQMCKVTLRSTDLVGTLYMRMQDMFGKLHHDDVDDNIVYDMVLDDTVLKNMNTTIQAAGVRNSANVTWVCRRLTEAEIKDREEKKRASLIHYHWCGFFENTPEGRALSRAMHADTDEARTLANKVCQWQKGTLYEHEAIIALARTVLHRPMEDAK